MTIIQYIAISFFLSMSLFCDDAKTTFITSSVPVITVQKNQQKSARILYGQASYYASKFEGRKTANGEVFKHSKLTAACNSLPLGTSVKITNLRNGKTVLVRINDRLHPKTKRLVDLTKTAAQKLGFIKSGLTRVKVEVLK